MPLQLYLSWGHTVIRNQVTPDAYLSGTTLFVWVFFIQFNIPFKIISLIETSQSVGGAKREYPGKTT